MRMVYLPMIIADLIRLLVCHQYEMGNLIIEFRIIFTRIYMDTSVNLENPQYSHPFDNEDLGLYPHRVNGQYMLETSEYSTQVNMDAEFPPQQLAKIKKRNKKKEYKRKKKQKIKEEERCAKIYLAELVDLIYKQQTTFEQCKQEIQNCLEILKGGDKFHSFLNQAIRIHINNVQKQIWDFMQDIMHQNPFVKPSEDQDFYLVMVDKIYLEYQKLRKSSIQIEKIINFFMLLNEPSQEMTECQNLDISTFSYLIQSDETIKTLIRICEKRISIRHYRQVKQLEQIGSMMRQDPDQFNQYQQYITQQSTQVDEDQVQQKQTKKTKKKKPKQSEFETDVQNITRRLNEMIIVDEGRTNCKTDESWLQKIVHHYEVGN